MSEITIRQVHGKAYQEAVYQLAGYAFEPTPPMPRHEDWDKWIVIRDDTTSIVLYEDDKPMTEVLSSPMTQNVRGKLYDIGGIWGVATHPSKRRGGYCTRTFLKMYEALHEDNRPLSCLYPFRESFYNKLGYVTFPQPRIVKFGTAALAPLLKWDLEGEVTLYNTVDGADIWQAYLRAQQRRIHGMAMGSDKGLQLFRDEGKYWVAIARVADEVVGAMVYQLKGDEGDFTMKIPRFYMHTPDGRYLLLDWMARHIDQASHVELRLPPAELPETWLPDMQVKTESCWPPMARVIDVKNIGGMQTGSGRFTARIADEHCPWNNGTYAFEGVDGVLHVSETDSAECDLDIRGLTALVYGTHDPLDFAVRGWGKPSPETQAAMRAIFPAMLPYIHLQF